MAGIPRKVPEQRRQDLVLAAFELLAEKGFEGLRTRDVAARAGVNIATLHYYFPTKEALIGGVVEHVMTRFRSTLEPHGSPDRQLRNHLRAKPLWCAETGTPAEHQHVRNEQRGQHAPPEGLAAGRNAPSSSEESATAATGASAASAAA